MNKWLFAAGVTVITVALLLVTLLLYVEWTNRPSLSRVSPGCSYNEGPC